MPSKTQTLDIEAFVQQKTQKHYNDNPNLVEDLRYFAKRAKEGAAISGRGVQEWIAKKYGMNVGRTRLANICRRNDITMWTSR